MDTVPMWLVGAVCSVHSRQWSPLASSSTSRSTVTHEFSTFGARRDVSIDASTVTAYDQAEHCPIHLQAWLS